MKLTHKEVGDHHAVYVDSFSIVPVVPVIHVVLKFKSQQSVRAYWHTQAKNVWRVPKKTHESCRVARRCFTPLPAFASRGGGGREKAAELIVGFLKKRGLIELATPPGDDEVTISVGDEPLGRDAPAGSDRPLVLRALTPQNTL